MSYNLQQVQPVLSLYRNQLISSVQSNPTTFKDFKIQRLSRTSTNPDMYTTAVRPTQRFRQHTSGLGLATISR